MFDQRGQFLRAALGRPPRPPHVARLVGRDWARRGGDASPRVRSPTDSVRWAGLAGDLLHHRHGTQPDQRDPITMALGVPVTELLEW